MNRTQSIHHWLHTIKKDDYQLSPLAGDASFRRYLRLCNNKGDRYILMDAPPPHEDVRPFIEVGALLHQAGLRTPSIIEKNVSEGFLLLEDFGDTTWAAALQQGQAVEPLFADALKQLSKIQAINTDQGLPHFDALRMRRECALWTDWYLPHATETPLSPALRDTLLDELTALFSPLLSLPKVVVHLDFHSRNLMLPADGLPLGVIDFQDALMGSITYDIASLLYDCYQDYSETKRQYWSHTFFHQLPLKQQQHFNNASDWHQAVRLTAMQRHLKAMGIFTRLATRDGKQQFLNEIPLTFKHLQQEMETIKLPKNYAISSFLTTHINHE